MLLVPSSQLTEGMCVAEKVCDHRGRVLIARGQRLGEYHLSRLRKFGINSLFIDPRAGAQPLPADKSDLRKACEAVFTAACPQRGKEGGFMPQLNPVTVRAAADSLVQSLLKTRRAVVRLSQCTGEQDYLAQHSVNVAVLAVALGIDLGLPHDTLRDIGSAMLLHDVGLTILPPDVTHRDTLPGPAEMRQLKGHTALGYGYLGRLNALSAEAAQLVLCHHERLDGTGYPQGLRADEMTVPMRIVAVAEAFDALTSDRCGIRAVLPDAALAWMLGHSGTHFEREIVLALSGRIALYPNGSAVRLTTGETGTVLGTFPHAPRRPVVLIQLDNRGTPLRDPMIVDLSQERSRAVARSAPTIEALTKAREAGMPVSVIDPAFACVG
jgi:HD-GYP domain-containing protein (c-di-GMP phosphodiesterase class II)